MMHVRDSLREYLVRIIYGTVVTIRIVYRLELDQIKFVPEDKGFTMEKMNLSDLDLMYSINEHEIPQGRYEDTKEMIKSSTSACYMVKNNTGDICGYGGIEFGKGRHAKILGMIKGINVDKTGNMTRDYTFKRFRGQGIHEFVIYSRCLILKNEGYKTAITRVAKNNIIAQHNNEKVGFRKILIEMHFHLFNRFPLSNYLLIPLKG